MTNEAYARYSTWPRPIVDSAKRYAGDVARTVAVPNHGGRVSSVDEDEPEHAEERHRDAGEVPYHSGYFCVQLTVALTSQKLE